ncbi:hypothetical protein LR48_Vigan98s000500 [Vigna angularis]|uniref:Uncharacterized protein n=1 Tax=Phaseolus angularis TaxID=3914 RepID=A0A0L9T423_PHAAN|nr:hypothetical protein LR48_Vigan98s000500 [Vigna angularis]
METKVDSREKEGNRTCRRHITEKKVRIGLTPVHQIESDLEQLKGQMKERLFSIKNGLLWNMTVSSMFDPASSFKSTQIRKRFWFL